MKKSVSFFLFIALLGIGFQLFAQQNNRPKLVVGIVIDQMRYDYLVRFADKYGDHGFKRLLRNGFHLENAHFNYIPTYTAVGHSSVFTGTTPANHGIVGNDWYDSSLQKRIYCVDDARYQTVGSVSTNGQRSPYRLQTTTLADQLRLAQNMRGKTIGISIKDRSAILPAGHTANAAYWYEGADQGKWISSSFYLNALPKWVEDFNNNGKANAYLNQLWTPYSALESYTESIEDDNPYEGLFVGETAPVFPHDLPRLRKTNQNYDMLPQVPFGNTFTTDFAEAAIIGESLGRSSATDFLSISYSSTDKIGHKYGVDSKEIEDTYIRMDLEIARLLKFLDKQIGKNQYTLVLTADHAAAQVPNYLKKLKIPAGYLDNTAFAAFVRRLAMEKYGTKTLIENISNHQIFLRRSTLKDLDLDIRKVENYLADAIIDFDRIYKTVTAHALQNTSYTSGILHLIQEGYNQKISGDIIFIPKPATLGGYYKNTGTGHGSGYSYDTHVPVIFYGKGIRKGHSKKYHPIIDIAPTLANLLQIEFTNGNSGTVIEGVFK